MPGSGEPRRAVFDRSVILSQLLFGVAFVVVLFTLLLFQPEMLVEPLTIAGIGVAFAVTGVTMLVPWHRVRRGVVMIVPILDIVAIGCIRIAEATSGIGLLWIFPTLWLATYFGARGAIIAIGSTGVMLWVSEFAAGRAFTPESIPSVVLLPIALVFVATSAVLSSRRTAAQRVLLQSQSQQLERAVRRANRQEALLAEVLDAVEFGVVRLDRDGRGAVMNAAYGRLYGIRRGDPTAAAAGTAFAEDGVTPLADADLPFARAVSGEEFDDVVTWIPDGIGGLRAVAVTSRALRDAEGRSDGSVIVARDVTAERRAVRARDDLVASVSHELRTPMTSVLGYVELSLDEPDVTPAIRRNLEVIERNGDRMLELIASILQGAERADAPAPLDLAPADLAQIVRDAVEAAAPRAAEREIAVRVTGDPVVVARVDAFRIRQVVDNVLSNAVKYNRHAGEVAIDVTVDGGTAHLVFRDSGAGIPAADLPRVFDRFYRADTVRRGTVHGSGLGLGIVRDLVLRHGGTIDLDSAIGRGTTVSIALPIAGPEDA
ncbi:cell wall metabolism sensor histidine kinase WalK [Agromyces sp. LHK192]|uniref:sensor histidine kinase n=1 Tax=Agromyces sp. LHK192 TaxID=2498704 RepID=UPI000FDC239D|nr:PAS domain-containing sensor histidine kinase [Agromyces sp. LHK192]